MMKRLLLKRCHREPTEPTTAQLVGPLSVETHVAPLSEPRRPVRSAVSQTINRNTLTYVVYESQTHSGRDYAEWSRLL